MINDKDKDQTPTPPTNMLVIDGKEIELSDRAWKEIMVYIAVAENTTTL